MPKLLVDTEWFEPIQPNAVLDTAYEEMLLERSELLFSGFVPVKVHSRVSSEAGTAFAHLALVDGAYKSWWIVLLETGSPPDSKYVVQQTKILTSARYGREFAAMLAGRNARLNLEALTTLFAREVPRVFLLLAHPPPPAVRDPEVRVGIAEIFESANGRRILRINGEHPDAPSDVVGACRRDPRMVANLLRLSLAGGESVPVSPCEIEVEGAASMWGIRPQAAVIWLIPDGSVTLPIGVNEFSLVRAPTGRLRLVPQTNQTGGRNG
jgi:hypothetical protein